MIDAYEVGIQLALQDGVSAGLDVIGRELAEVDRAIAASNAGLVALTQAAESAVRAAAAAAGARVPAQVQARREAAPEGEAKPAAQGSAPTQAAASAAVVPRMEPVTSEAATTPRVGRADVSSETVRGEPAVASAGAGEATQAAAPTRDDAVMREPAQPIAASAAAEPAAPSVPQIAGAAAPAETRVQASGPAQEGALAPIVSPPPAEAGSAPAAPATPMRASVAQAVAPRTRRETVVREANAQNGVSLSMPVNVAIPETPAAPGVLGSQGMAAPKGTAGSLERGAAPQPQARERSEGGGGSVMLDGRLVGYWLTEQMARDAARPPGGTSFFDPRQSPAWTPSGAL